MTPSCHSSCPHSLTHSLTHSHAQHTHTHTHTIAHAHNHTHTQHTLSLRPALGFRDSPRRPLNSSTGSHNDDDDYGDDDDDDDDDDGNGDRRMTGSGDRSAAVASFVANDAFESDTTEGTSSSATDGEDGVGGENGGDGSSKASLAKKSKELLVMALITGTAIALHNFPEGLATFVATAKVRHPQLALTKQRFLEPVRGTHSRQADCGLCACVSLLTSLDLS